MEEEELEEVAAETESLTDIAIEVLRSEMLRRGMASPPKITKPGTKAVESPDPPKPVMIRRYRDLPEASIAKSVLDSAGVESFLVDDNTVRLDWFYSNLIGGIKLLVREEDADTANRLLDQNVLEEFDVEGVGEFEQPRCPRCQSMNVSLDGLDKRMTYGALLVGLPIPITNKGWKCHECSHSWKSGSGVQTAPPGPIQPL